MTVKSHIRKFVFYESLGTSNYNSTTKNEYNTAMNYPNFQRNKTNKSVYHLVNTFHLMKDTVISIDYLQNSSVINNINNSFMLENQKQNSK